MQKDGAGMTTLVSGYCELIDLTNYYGGVESSATLLDAIDQASRDVDQVTLDQFYQEDITKTFSVQFTRDYLPVRPYLAEMTKVEYCADIDDDGVKTWEEIDLSSLETDGREIRFVSYTDADNRDVTGGLFPCGKSNVRVTGTWGRDAVPLIIKRATINRAIEILNREKTYGQSLRDGALSDAVRRRLHGASGGIVG